MALDLRDRIAGKLRDLQVESGTLAFSFCQTPILYELSQRAWLRVIYGNGEISTIAGNACDRQTSRHIFTRSGTIRRIEVGITERSI